MRDTMIGFIIGCLITCLSGCSGGSKEAKVEDTYQEFRKAVKMGDVHALKLNVSSRYAAEFLAPGREQKLAMLKAVLPDSFEIKNLDVREKEAIVRSQGLKDGMAVKGTTTLIKEGGEWKVFNESWTFEASATEVPVIDQNSADTQTPAVSSFATAGESENQKSVAQLMDDLKNPNYYGKEPVLDSLLKRGAREEAVRALNEILRSKPDFPRDIKELLKQANAPVTFDWRKNSFEPEETKFKWQDVECEYKNGRIFTAGRVYLGREVVAGFSRPQNATPPYPLFAKCNFRVKGGTLVAPIEKEVELERRAGEHSWNNMEIASGLGKGEYDVSLLLHAQTVMPDGVPMSLTAGPVILTLEGE